MSRDSVPPPPGAVAGDLDGLDERQLWQRLRGPAESATKARSELFERYTGLVRSIAARLFGRRVDNVSTFEDYLQLGSEGLLEALDRYDPGRGASFETFATYRIRGAIQNGVRISSERNELSSYRARRHRERVRSLAASGGSDGSGDAFGEMVDLTIDLALGFLLEDNEAERTQSRSAGTDPYACEAIAELQAVLVKLLDTLPERERQILEYHYFQQLPFRAIAELMGLTKGRISQLHHKALRGLRGAVGPERKLDSYL